MLAEVCLQRFGVPSQLTLRTREVQLLELLNAALQVSRKVGPQGVLRNRQYVADLPAGQALAFNSNASIFSCTRGCGW